MRRVSSSMKRMLFTLLALVSVSVAVAACNDNSRSAVEPDPFGGPGFSTSGEAIELDPLIVTACPPGTSGMYPDCQPEGCDPSFDASCNPDPCFYDSSAPGCGGDPCSYDSTAPGCGDDPCAYGACGGGDPGDTSGEPSAAAPEGIDQSEYDKLNRTEKLLCWTNREECGHVIFQGRGASQWARNQTPELGSAEGDNKRDALRHTAWQALLTWMIGEDRARVWGDAHEESSTSPLATCMDQHNNAVGRSIGRTTYGWDNIYAATAQAWNEGRLHGSPYSC